MGKYITTTTIYTDILSRITTATCAPSVLSAYINDAEGVIDGYIAKQYTIATIAALSPTPPILVKAAKDLTICMVFSDSYSRDNQSTSDWVERRCTSAYGLIKDIADDKVRLVSGNVALSPNIGASMKTSMRGVSLAMNIDDQLDWKTSQMQLDTIKSSRDLNV